MRKLKQGIISLALTLGITVSFVAVPSVSAVDVFQQCSKSGGSAVCQSTNANAPSMMQTVINTLLYVLAMVAVIMIIIGGIRYTTSNGDSGSMKSAKDTILYSVVGLVLAILSFAIVNFVLERF